MIETPITERLDYLTNHDTIDPTTRNGLTPSIGILIVFGIAAALWHTLGGITMDTTVNIVIKIPAWLIFLGGLGLIVGTVFAIRFWMDGLRWN